MLELDEVWMMVTPGNPLKDLQAGKRNIRYLRPAIEQSILEKGAYGLNAKNLRPPCPFRQRFRLRILRMILLGFALFFQSAFP